MVFDIGPLRPAGCGMTGAPACLGTPPPPITNVPPELGVDPHDRTGFALPALQQFLTFLAPNGKFIDNCGPRPCYAEGWTGP